TVRLTPGAGVVFRGSIVHRNIDGGCDMFAWDYAGAIGAVTVENCVSYGNDFLSNGVSTADSDRRTRRKTINFLSVPSIFVCFVFTIEFINQPSHKTRSDYDKQQSYTASLAWTRPRLNCDRRSFFKTRPIRGIDSGRNQSEGKWEFP